MGRTLDIWGMKTEVLQIDWMKEVWQQGLQFGSKLCKERTCPWQSWRGPCEEHNWGMTTRSSVLDMIDLLCLLNTHMEMSRKRRYMSLEFRNWTRRSVHKWCLKSWMGEVTYRVSQRVRKYSLSAESWSVWSLKVDKMRDIQQRRQGTDGQRSRHWLGKVLSRGRVKTISQGDHCEQVSNAVEAGSQFWEVTDPYIYQRAGHWFHWHELFFCLFLPLILFFSFIFISGG